MSSPSSAGSSKRKRNNSLLLNTHQSSTADLLQPSSRDASGEEAAEATMAAGTKHKKTANSIDSTNPPAKRARTRSSVAEAASSNGNNAPSITAEDPGEPSDSTEASTDIARRSKVKKTISKESNGESTKSSPPKPRIIKDPEGGYKTNPPPEGRPVRVYADGVFDLFHLGHMRQLEQAKTAFPNTYLIVGVTGDEETHKRKGLTVLTGKERAETVSHCKWVDEVLPNCPWIVDAEFLEEHEIDYVAHDDLPYGAAEGDDIYKPIKEQGKFLVTDRTEGVSTTGIITKIVRDYEQYITRQLKRGTSRQELNISWLKKNEMDLKRHVNELRDNIKNNWTSTGTELTKELHKLWNSRPGSPARGLSRSNSQADLRSPTAVSHLQHLDIPRQGASNDFATGYSLGLIGGVRSWMTKSRVSLQSSRPVSLSPSSSEDDSEGNGSPASDKITRGRSGSRSKPVENKTVGDKVAAADKMEI